MRLLVIPLVLVLLAADEPTKPEVKLSDAEKSLLELINKERAKEKLAPLAPNAKLFEIARAHTKDMAAKQDLNHVLNNKTPIDRADAVGYDFKKLGENIARTDTGSLEMVVKGWLDSPSHRETLLHPAYQDTGIGISKSEKGDVYFTQVFGVQRKK